MNELILHCGKCGNQFKSDTPGLCPTCKDTTEKGGEFKMETDILNTGIGTKAIESLEPGKVKVVGVRQIDKHKKNSDEMLHMIGVICKHPAREETIELSNAKVVVNEKQIKVAALWINKDEDGNLQKGSTAAEVLNYYKVNNFNDLVGKEIELVTQSETNKYLCIKLY